LPPLGEGAANPRHREELIRLLDALVEDHLELVDRRLEVRIALRPEELDELVRVLVGRDLLPRLLLGVGHEEGEFGRLAPVLVALEAGSRSAGRENENYRKRGAARNHQNPPS